MRGLPTLRANPFDHGPDLRHWKHRDAVVERVFLIARINDPKMVQPQILERHPHRPRGARDVRELALEAVTLPSGEHEEIEFGAG